MISFSKNAACTRLTLVLFGENLDPQAVSMALGMPDTKSFKKGDTFAKGRGVRKRGMWSVEVKFEGILISKSIASLLDRLPQHLLPVSRIDGVESGRLSIWFDTPNDGSVFEISIDDDDISQINRLGVQLYMTIFPDIEDD